MSQFSPDRPISADSLIDRTVICRVKIFHKGQSCTTVKIHAINMRVNKLAGVGKSFLHH